MAHDQLRATGRSQSLLARPLLPASQSGGKCLNWVSGSDLMSNFNEGAPDQPNRPKFGRLGDRRALRLSALRLRGYSAKAPENERKRSDTRWRRRIRHNGNSSLLKIAPVGGSCRQRRNRVAGLPDASH